MDNDEQAGKGTALVTGASRGIGYELARLFAGTGYDVALVARSEDELAEAADYFSDRFGVEATVLPMDLSEPGAAQDIYDACQDRDLTVTALVNNAGFGTSGAFVDTDLDTELDEIQVNVTAVTHLTKQFGREMAERGEGKILNVGSVAGFAPGGPGMAVYYGTKAYVRSFSEGIAEELAGEGVTVTCLCPGPVDTDFHDRADLDSSLMDRFSMDSRSVARAGYRGLMKGETVVVPGIAMRTLVFADRLLPRSVSRRIAGVLNADR